jgi:hypothetical protein
MRQVRPAARHEYLLGSGESYVTLYSGLADRFDLLNAPKGMFAWDVHVPFAEDAHTPLTPDPTDDAIQAVRELGGRFVPLVESLPADLAERLGFDRSYRPRDWARVVFHLGWHFPAHGIEAVRGQILAAGEWRLQDYLCPELSLQLGLAHVTPEVFPGVVVSRLADGCDFLPATGHALRLLLEAVEGVERSARVGPRAEFAEFRAEFLRLGDAYATCPDGLGVDVLRLSDSFRTRPAAEWAGLGGAAEHIPPRLYLLAHQDAERVVCRIYGAAAEAFVAVANRAGALLPIWPAERYPAFLGDAELGIPCHPGGDSWTAGGDTGGRGMVTDHRGNVERWLGMVFGRPMTDGSDHLDLVTYPTGGPPGGGGPVNTRLTLRGLDLFAASARTIDLVGLVPPPTPHGRDTRGSDDRPPGVSRPARPLAPQCVLDTLADFDEAAAGLAAFSDPTRPFAEVSGSWDAWRLRVAAKGTIETEAALRGWIDRAPAAPHRGLPDELRELWLEVKTWGTGRATTWEVFGASDHSERRSVLIRRLESWRRRLVVLFHYLGLDVPAVHRPVAEAATPSTSTTPAGPDHPGADPMVDDREWAVLTALRDRHPVRMKNVEIEAAAGASKQTVGEVVSGLIARGLAARPPGNRRGVALTPAGLAVVDRIRKSSLTHPQGFSASAILNRVAALARRFTMADSLPDPTPAPSVLAEIQAGEGLSLAAAGRLFPGHRGGRAVDPSTVFRWVTDPASAASPASWSSVSGWAKFRTVTG